MVRISQVPRAMEHQATLLLRRLGLNKTHTRSHDGFADCLCVGSIILLTFDVGVHTQNSEALRSVEICTPRP